MAAKFLGMIETLDHEIGAAAGEEVRRQVMAGAEGLTPKTKPQAVALWLQGAMQRLDELAPQVARQQAMQACGVNCSLLNHGVIDRGKARRAKFKTEEEFLAAEMKKPSAGTRLERQGSLLYQIYTPQAWSHPMRCYCGLLHGLPEEAQVSPTYCYCSQAFVKSYWEGVLGRSLDVEVLSTAISGAAECTFKINLAE